MAAPGEPSARCCSRPAQNVSAVSSPRPARRRAPTGRHTLVARENDLRMKDQSRRTMLSSQYELHDSAGVGEGWSGDRGRVLSQSHFVAWERPRCELGSNLVIATTGITTGEGHVVDCSDSQRTRKIFAGCPASVPFRGQSPLHFSSRSVQRPRSVGNRPIRHYGLRSLRRTAAEAQIQDPSRQKTGPNTAPAFSRVSNPTPLRFAKGDASAASRGMPEIHRSYFSSNNVSPAPRVTTPPHPRGRLRGGHR